MLADRGRNNSSAEFQDFLQRHTPAQATNPFWARLSLIAKVGPLLFASLKIASNQSAFVWLSPSLIKESCSGFQTLHQAPEFNSQEARCDEFYAEEKGRPRLQAQSSSGSARRRHFYSHSGSYSSKHRAPISNARTCCSSPRPSRCYCYCSGWTTPATAPPASHHCGRSSSQAGPGCPRGGRSGGYFGYTA